VIDILSNNFPWCISKMFNSDHYYRFAFITYQSIFLAKEGISIILRINTEFQWKLWGLCMLEKDRVMVSLFLFLGLWC